MKRRLILGASALVLVVCPQIARADDPNDPAMRNRAARERDAAEIRRLNREQLAYVQRRDAGYAQGWKAWRERHEGGQEDATADEDRDARAAYADERDGYAQARDGYARDRADYARAMADWRRQVRACEAGDDDACE